MTFSTLLDGILVVDRGQGMASALIAKALAEHGARVVRAVSPENEVFDRIYPAAPIWRSYCERAGPEECAGSGLDGLLAKADICLLGGEDHPDVVRSGAGDLPGTGNRRLIALDIAAFPPKMGRIDAPGADILAQAASGLTWEHFSEEPIRIGFEPANYGAVLQGLAALYAALIEREATGVGQVVRTSLFEGALTWGIQLWGKAERPTMESEFCVPRDVRPLIFRCADGEYLHIAFGTPGAAEATYRVLGIAAPAPGGTGLATAGVEARNFFGEIDLIAEHVAPWQSAALAEALVGANVVANIVQKPGAIWSDPQCEANAIVNRTADGTRHLAEPVMLNLRAGQGDRVQFANENGPLGAARVLDLGAFVAGPMASVTLADLGADVIKVEAITGDATRIMFRCDTAVNRGKRTIKLDLKAPAGREVVERLCARSDLVMNNFRTGVSSRLGLDAQSLQSRYPNISVLEGPAYGVTGPRAMHPGFDMAMQAACGHEYRAGGEGNPPLWSRTTMVDYCTGLLGSVASLMCLYARARSGTGAFAYVPLFHGALFLLSELIEHADGRFEGAPPLAPDRRGVMPQEAIYAATDGWVAIVARGSATLSLAAALGLADGLPVDASTWGAAERAAIGAAVKALTVAELEGRLRPHNIWVERCVSVADNGLLDNAVLSNASIIRLTEHPRFGEVAQVGTLFHMEKPWAGASRHAPVAGEHSREILAELGYGSSEIDALFAERVVA